VILQLIRFRWTRLVFGAAIGIAGLLSAVSSTLALPGSADAPEPGTINEQSAPPTRAVGAATQVVDTLHDNLISVMKNAQTLGYDGRFERLEPVISELFDIPFMAEKSVGRYWKNVDDADRGRLLTTFGQFTVANYAGRFTDYSGQSFETFKEEVSKHGTVMVYSRLDTGKGEKIQLNYRLRPDPRDGWKIIDVLLNGTVSELALRRSEYSSLIQREGFAALMKALNERIDELASGKVTDHAS